MKAIVYIYVYIFKYIYLKQGLTLYLVPLTNLGLTM